MNQMIWLAAGLVLGVVMAWLWTTRKAGASAGTIGELRAQTEAARADFEALRQRLDTEREARVRAETELAEAAANLAEQKETLEEAKNRLTDTFKALSDDALKSNNQAFLELAKKTLDSLVTEAKGDLSKRQEAIDSLIKPLRESLKNYEDHIRTLEQSRQKAYGTLEERLKTLTTTHQRLEKETHNLGAALRNPQTRGAWGEMTLRRVVELAGMSEHCDFTEQASVPTEEGTLRPDMVVHLPGGRQVVVDAKTPLQAYMNAIEADSEPERERCLRQHARQAREHMNALSRKAYWESLPGAVDLVVMFIPGEPFLGAALSVEPTLLEDGMKNRIGLATPTTLIALLHAVAYGWRQEALARNAEEISELGRDLYDRLRVLAEHLGSIGGALEKANDAFNKAVGSMERRVFPAARRFKDLGVTAAHEIPTIEPVETTPRKLQPPGTEPSD
ncbi:MAG: DNA recombination protein RmuC [Planctomycetota bacterium]|jgi:DNA recombination protein RmuC